MRGRPGFLLQSAGGEANRILLASALSSMCIICPNRVSRHDWIITVSLGWFVSLCTSSFNTNWYHLIPSSICRQYWSSASILCASILDMAQHSKPYRNIADKFYLNKCYELKQRFLHDWHGTGQTIIDNAIDEWHGCVHACACAKNGHFVQLLWQCSATWRDISVFVKCDNFYAVFLEITTNSNFCHNILKVRMVGSIIQVLLKI